MIDLISIVLDIEHKKFGSERKKRTEDGEVKTKQFTKTIHINHVPVFVTSMNDGTRIYIRCCPLKVFQGHNVFGTNRLKLLWVRLIVDVMKELNITPSKLQLQEWLRGEFAIEEIHITHRFSVKEYSMVRKVVHHVRRYARESLFPSPIRKGTGITLRGEHHHASALIYDKCREFGDKRTKEQKYLEAVVGDKAEDAKRLLSQLASKSIRFELKLKKEYLRDNQLDRGKFWTSRKSVEVFSRELELMRLNEIPAMATLPEVYAGIDNPKLRSVVILWANGEDMTEHYASSTIRKYRKSVLEVLGIDILNDQPVLETACIKMSEVFDIGNMLTGFPKWARKYPELALR